MSISRRAFLSASAGVGALSVLPTMEAEAKVAPGRFVANFVMPESTLAGNKALLQSMNCDAITFGPKLSQVSKSSLPSAVNKLCGSKRVFLYKAPFFYTAGKKVIVGGTTWCVLVYSNGETVVWNHAGKADKYQLLVQAGNQLGYKVALGLPAPDRVSPSSAYVNASYLPTLSSFTKMWVRVMLSTGAEGFYHHTEMPLSDSFVWNSTISLYKAQNSAITSVKKGVPVIIAPYCESRLSKAYKTPSQSKSGLRKVLGTASGVDLFVAPQDGLGTGCQGFTKSGRAGSIYDYLAAWKEVAGSRLLVTSEIMAPQGSSRVPTNLSRVSSQLSLESRYTRGSIGFMWNNGTPMSSIKGITKFSAGRGQLF